MNELNVKSYHIGKISNPNVYRRILVDIRKIDGVRLVNIDKERNILNVEYAGTVSDIYTLILKAFIKYEKHVVLQEFTTKEKHRKVLKLKGIDCAHCALKIESLAKKKFNCDLITVDVATERFIIETSDTELLDDIVARLTVITKTVDSEIVVMDVKARQRLTVDETYKISIAKVIVFGLGLLFLGAYILYCSLSHGWLQWLEEGRHDFFEWLFIITSFLLVGNEVIEKFVRNTIKGRLLDENFLMTIACIGAFVTGHLIEAVSVMCFYQVGEYFQERAVNYSRRSISKLLSLEATKANLLLNGEEMVVEIESILPGDEIIVKHGEMIPLDGVIIDGKTFIDTKALTGETKQNNVKAGDEVLSGSINLGSVVTIKVTRPYSESTMSQILDLVENASANKARSEKFITKFAQWYTPIVVAIALVVAFIIPFAIYLFNVIFSNDPTLWQLLMGGNGRNGSIYNAMVFLVISCPCALVISIPLSFFSAIGACSKRGILVKGSNYIEDLHRLENVVFDKTGTLTKGMFGVTDVVPANENVSKEDLLRNVIYAEYYSTHPIAISIVDEYGRNKVFPELVENFSDMPGRGVKAVINGSWIVVANIKYMNDQKITVPDPATNGLRLYVLKEKIYLGYVVVTDVIREEAAEVITNLKRQGAKNTYMLTGDTYHVANYVANAVNIDEVYAELLPIQKVDILNQIKKDTMTKKGKTIYIGDGINDAPVISSADIGIAMGLTGSEGAIAIADIVIMSDNLTKLNEAVNISKKTKTVVYQNIIFALGTKMLVMLLSVLNIPVSIWLAIFADVGVSLLAILNSLRIIGRHKNGYIEVIEGANNE